MVRQKGLLVILDGLGDLPAAALGGRTPLEAARTPVLDGLLERGACGLVDPLSPGIPVGTQTGVAALFGIVTSDLEQLSRGAVEAAGVGLPLEPGDIAFHCNFATLTQDDAGFAIVDRRAGRIREGTDELAAALDGLDLGDGVRTSFRAATQHRAVLRLTGGPLSAAISDTDPGAGAATKRVLPCEAIDDGDAATRTAAIVNRWTLASFQRLRDHPVNRARSNSGRPEANGILVRGAGGPRKLASRVSHLGLRTAVVAAECTVLGLASVLGYTRVTDSRFTALLDTDVDAKVAAARAALADHDLVYLHIKGTDICAHDRDPDAKRAFTERVDAALAPLLADESLVVGVTADHTTDSFAGRHTGDPVPAILTAPRSRRDACATFSEVSCMAGGLGRIPAGGFLASLLDAMGALPNFRPGAELPS